MAEDKDLRKEETKEYSADSIQVLEGLEAVRVRPGMYIGTTGVKGLHHILWEIVDNAIDEAANGYADRIDIVLYKDGSASVYDNGRGIPVDIHPKLKVSGVEVVFTQLHAGGKFDSESYSYSGGLHGVGASVTNALSSWLTVEVYKDKKLYRQEFESSEVDGTFRSGHPKGPLKIVGDTDKKGSFIIFKPDPTVFDTVQFNFETIAKRIKELAFLNKGVTFTLTDENTYNDDGEFVKKQYCYQGGIVDFVEYLDSTKVPLFKVPIFIEGEKSGFKMQLAIQLTDSYTESVFSYVNNIPTTEGGTHETGFKAAYTKCFNDYMRKNGYLKEKEENLMGEDFREGMTAVLSVKMHNAQFEGQTKTKLGNSEAKITVDAMVTAGLTEYLDNKKNFTVIETIIKKAQAAQKVRLAAKKAKDITRQKNSIDNSILVGKLSNCTGRKAELNEIFIVEGDSAGGSAKQGRDRSTQAILPLRGKPLNAEKKRVDEVLDNEEIRTIISALGAGFAEDFNPQSLKYNKIIILADADQDGAHIRAILLTFFFRYMKELIMDGHLFIGMPPLYKVYKKDECVYAYSDAELDDAIKQIGRGYKIQRYKGLGEMNPEQLWETTLDPEHRTLTQVTLEDAAEAESIISTLMGSNVESRKQYIAEHANFNKEDSFKDKVV